MSAAYNRALFCTWSLLLIGCDRVSKTMAKDLLEHHDPLSYLHDSVRLEYAENTGAFLSLGAGWPSPLGFWVLGMLPLWMLLAFLGYALRASRAVPFGQMLPLILIFSGGIGNIMDRLLFDRHVTDFINLGWGQTRTGIFNVADLYVSGGALLFLLGRLAPMPGKSN